MEDNKEATLQEQLDTTMAENNQIEIKHDVAAMGIIKLPTFLQTDPELWFAQIEGLLHVHRITANASKFYTVITALDHNTLHQVADIAKCQSITDKFIMLKKELIKRFGESKQKQLVKLLTNLELSNKRPTQLLREMQN
ncbi:uncharacterized protein LOC119666182 [Teleopsis dalmanni]|uniref:uncharacterized protein LOC119666182 n=1 Tax=Teleopsis dalmanni TaxID=139649 RepID=UPI0018CF0036|nr:uncharacterized protein LOC119666182 [Teleopsis dalmanni]